MKKTRKGIKNLINIKNSQRINITQITNNGKSIDDPKEISNTFNNYFTKAFRSTAWTGHTFTTHITLNTEQNQ